MAVLSKSQMSEEDVKFHYITPAITAKWNNQQKSQMAVSISKVTLWPVKSRNVQTMCFT